MKHCIQFLTTFFILLIGLSSQASEVYGLITNEKGEPLPFATVYAKGTSVGTTSNEEGNYTLELKPGTYQLIYQYIGYKKTTETVKIGQKSIELNVALKPQSVELTEIVVDANAEDPAYRVIREAIKKRKYYLEQVKAYSCDVYIKGNQRLNDAPDKILGQEVGDLGGSLDTNRQGIVYLSESVSKLYYKAPNDYKEEMISSKVSGNDNGFSFNQARAMDFNFYEDKLNLGRPIISPISGVAMRYYRFKLEGTYYDEDGRLINQIQVIPKNEYDPVFSGQIYIVENDWNIHSTALYVTKSSSKIQFLDTVMLKQVHIPVEEGTWRMLSQTIEFRMGLFGFDIQGVFTGVFTNYNLQPNFEPSFFTNEILVVQDSANRKNETYWDSIRPIPLTEEESVDYVKKDSIQEVRSSKKYLDSVDTESNRFKIMNALFGYNYSKSYERESFNIAPLINTISFNAVQGWNLALDMKYRKAFDDYNGRWYSIQPKLQYGFSDNELRGSITYEQRFNRLNYRAIEASFGHELTQFNANEPVSTALNASYSLFDKQNLIRLYEKSFGKIGFKQEIWNGVYFKTSLEYANRRPVGITTQYDWCNCDDESYADNIPNNLNYEFSPDAHQALIWEARVRLRYQQKYLSYPNRKILLGSKVPDLWLIYRKGINGLGSDVDFDWVGFETQEGFPIGTAGFSQIKITGGTFLNTNQVEFVDFNHFNGNQTTVGNPAGYLNSFNLLPYYFRSTTDSYLTAHYQHNFNGFIWDRLPLLKKLGFSVVGGASALIIDEQDPYFELNVGIDKIGWGILRLLRIDYYMSFDQNGQLDSGFIYGIKVPLN